MSPIEVSFHTTDVRERLETTSQALYFEHFIVIDRVAEACDAVMVKQPAKFELVVKLKLAKALGFTNPQSSCCAQTR